MRRVAETPRPDRRERAAALGFAFAEIEGEPYWDETASYRFTAAEVDALDDATAELERISRLAVDHAVRWNRREILGIGEADWALAKASWRAGEPSLYGRMDLRWDGSGPPKLLEYNADTPTALFEASVVQWEWLRCTDPGLDQFNGIHEALIAAWPAMDLPGRVHFACVAASAEDRGTVDYLRDTALQAGLEAPFLAVGEIGWGRGRFRDREERPIDAVFKLYPWDWLLRERFARMLRQDATAAERTRWIEPPWRMIPAGKGFLALLWEMFPGHPNLLPAFREPGRTGRPEIGKPFWGREGANLLAPGGQRTPGPYGDQPVLWQEWAELPRFGGRYPVLGSWVVAGRPCGLGIREDATPLTRDTSRFVPHAFTPHEEPRPA
ncbi:glutathionylspermidine synthase family protein [Roseomonas sp. OT10]|uniref:glutathionylspermidine synthase family protein n=1 Tax=Roseomonas cutis TaxID=2897332 RepID=UPI001E4D97AB|nr:glutathionylspermidine synthase family protein [Roseomonas sp. OT10]UFN50300.1 glutathionylspermidine synthase family protein [Roseomonas sp. OT10]